MNVLLIGGGTQGLAFISPLTKLGYKVFLLAEEKNNYADVSRYLAGVIVPTVKISDDAYLDYILSVIRDNNVSVVIPMGDSSAEFVSKHIDKLSSVVIVKMPDY